MPITHDVFTDLMAEGDNLDGLVAGLRPEDWTLSTPAPGWTVAHQIAHITSTAWLAGLAASDRDAFERMAKGQSGDFDAALDAALRPYLSDDPAIMLATWRQVRVSATASLAALPPDEQVPWLTRWMPASSLASAGIMELFAHGQDIADTVGAERGHTDRIVHLVNFAVQNWQVGYLARGLKPPREPFRYEITAPSGSVWKLGPDEAVQCVRGPAVDFCLLVTRRRHRDDLAVTASGPDADQWLDIAQAYRGSPGQGRRPGQFRPVTCGQR